MEMILTGILPARADHIEIYARYRGELHGVAIPVDALRDTPDMIAVQIRRSLEKIVAERDAAPLSPKS